MEKIKSSLLIIMISRKARRTTAVKFALGDLMEKSENIHFNLGVD